MDIIYSDQEAKRYAKGNQFSDGYSEVDGNKSVTRFTKTTASTASGDVMYAARLPKGSVLMQGEILHGALGAGVTLAAGSLGVVSGTAAPAAYLTAADSAAAGIKTLFATRALGRLTVLAEETIITVTVGGANAADGIYLDGYIEFLQN